MQEPRSAQAGTAELRRALDVLILYSKNYVESTGNEGTLQPFHRNLIHILQTYTQGVLRNKALAQILLVDGIVDVLFVYLRKSSNAQIKTKIFNLLTNFLCSLESGELPAVIILKQPDFTQILDRNMSSEDEDLKSSVLQFYKNLTCQEQLLPVKESVFILFQLLSYYNNSFSFTQQVLTTNIFLNVFCNDKIKQEFRRSCPNWFDQ